MTILGIDLSHWNAGVSLNIAKEMGVKFAYIKLSEGTNFVDDKAHQFFTSCNQLGIKASFYHYWKANVGGKQQAEHMLKYAKPYENKIGMPVALDVEDKSGTYYTKTKNSENIYKFAKQCQDFAGFPEIMIYTSASKWDSFVNPNAYEFWRLGLWVAHWGAGGNPAIPNPWKSKKTPFTIHQYGTINIGGKRIDGNKWNTKYHDFPPKKEDPEPPTQDKTIQHINVIYNDGSIDKFEKVP
jgi:GH25 family lysozyme M1 (1,4-beta-N-acetylmuramidase)